MLRITDKLLKDISDGARNSKRKRKHLNFHKDHREPVQRLVNALEPGTYLRPHRHTDSGKLEILLILNGRVLLVTFDDHGNMKDHAIMDANERDEVGVEIPPETWHTVISLKPGSVLYEIKEGPFDEKKAKVYAKWAPEEGSNKGKSFNKKILEQLQLI